MEISKPKLIRRILWPLSLVVTGIAVVGVTSLLWANGVDTTVTDDDLTVVSQLDVDRQCATIDDFDDEITCIETLQQTIYDRYPDTSDAFKKGETNHQVRDYDRRGFGSCYDRSRLIEQALRHYGFDVRRVALYRRQSNPLAYLTPGIDSHALSEVRTTRGWMAIDSVDPLVAVDEAGTVYDIGDIRQGLNDGSIDETTFDLEIPDDFFDGEFVSFYGVYSRHGYFFEPHLPVPEINWTRFGIGTL